MKLKALLLFLFTVCTFANYQYYNFDKSKLKLHRDSYYRYIRPQLRNIKTEFYHIAKKISPIHQQLVKVREDALKLKLEYSKVYKECEAQQKEQVYCDVDVNKILKSSYSLDKSIINFRFYFNKNSDNYLKVDTVGNFIQFSKHLDELDVENSKIQRFLELRKMVDKTLYSTYTNSFTDLSNTVNRVFTLANFAFIDLLPPQQQSTFESLLVHFISPLEEKMIAKFSPSWFKNHLGKLNLSWNTFHMNIEKGQTNFPRRLITTVKIMHNRWNSVLKIIF
jgi:hypothetical protein